MNRLLVGTHYIETIGSISTKSGGRIYIHTHMQLYFFIQGFIILGLHLLSINNLVKLLHNHKAVQVDEDTGGSKSISPSAGQYSR